MNPLPVAPLRIYVSRKSSFQPRFGFVALLLATGTESFRFSIRNSAEFETAIDVSESSGSGSSESDGTQKPGYQIERESSVDVHSEKTPVVVAQAENPEKFSENSVVGAVVSETVNPEISVDDFWTVIWMNNPRCSADEFDSGWQCGVPEDDEAEVVEDSTGEKVAIEDSTGEKVAYSEESQAEEREKKVVSQKGKGKSSLLKPKPKP